ncbi:dihydrodipicolinate synthase family protein [Terriglobus sp. RCC_193]|uniref:dihydrodipicolinate synthase family protein n=1 Tax=Terriglobus sp. RCC_193 TaxID=3239218 RepID=UPI003524B455
MLFEGVHVPLATPFYPDGRLNLRKLEHNVRRYSLTPTSGLIALGANSEMASLSSEERVEVLKTVAAEAAKEKVLTAGIGLPGVRESLLLAQAAADARFDAVLLGAPLEYRHLLWNATEPTAACLTYFEAIADGSPLPVVLYSDADSAPLPLALIARLATHPNVIGILEQSTHVSRVVQVREATVAVKHTATTTITFTAATGRMLAVEQLATVVAGTFVSASSLSGGTAVATAPPVPALKTRTKEVGFQIIWGSTADAAEALRAGVGSLAMPLAASVPQAAFEVWAAWKDGDPKLLAEKQGRLARAEQGILSWDTPSIKAASELSGYFGGRPRLPLLSVTANRAEEIASLLRGMNS